MAKGRRAASERSGRPIGARRRRDEAVEVEHVDTGETPQVAPVVEDASSRFGQLRSAVENLRTRGGGGDVERWLLVAGAILVPLGLVAILLGWRGASQSPYVFDQIPYMISGGLLGVGFIALGGFLYFGYWLTRIVREQQATAERVASALERVEELLGGGTAGNGNGSRRPARTASSRSAGATTKGFVATRSGSMFHRPDCVVVEGKEGLRAVTGREKGMDACGICDPLAA